MTRKGWLALTVMAVALAVVVAWSLLDPGPQPPNESRLIAQVESLEASIAIKDASLKAQKALASAAVADANAARAEAERLKRRRKRNVGCEAEREEAQAWETTADFERAGRLAALAALEESEERSSLSDMRGDTHEERAAGWERHSKKQRRMYRTKIALTSIVSAGAGLGAGYAWGSSR